MSDFTESVAKDRMIIRQQSSKIIEEVSMEGFALSDFKKIFARLFTVAQSMKNSIAKMFKRELQLTGKDKEDLKVIEKFIGDRKNVEQITNGVDFTEVTVFVPRHLREKALPTITLFDTFFDTFPAKLLEELKEANKILGTLINKPEERTSSRVQDLISPTLTAQTEEYLKAFDDIYDPRYTGAEMDFFDLYDNFTQFKEVGEKLTGTVLNTFTVAIPAIRKEVDILSEGMQVFAKSIKAGDEGAVSPEVLKNAALACDKFIESTEIYTLSIYRLKEFLEAYVMSCKESFR